MTCMNDAIVYIKLMMVHMNSENENIMKINIGANHSSLLITSI